MINLKFLKYVFFISTIVFTQNEFNLDGKRNGPWIGYHDNGVIKYTGQFLNGLEYGLFRYYNLSKNLVIELNYIDTGTISDAILYYKNGVIKSTGRYINRKKQSSWSYYDKYGQKNSQENYSNGIQNGQTIYYYSSSQISDLYMFVDGVKNGPGKIFYPSGNLNMSSYYVNDQKHGLTNYYYDNKLLQLESTGKYYKGLKDSLWIFYNEEGELLLKEVYDKGVILIKE